MKLKPTAYVAGPSAELERVMDVARALSGTFTIIAPWWRRVSQARARWGEDGVAPDWYTRSSAHIDMDGVREAAVVFIVCRNVGGLSMGSASELTAAVALRKEVVLIGDPGNFIFAHLVHWRFEDVEGALEWWWNRHGEA